MSSDWLTQIILISDWLTGLLRDNDQRPGKCTDYLQLGVDDNTPFITWNKSDKLCGHFTGFNYNDDQVYPSL